MTITGCLKPVASAAESPGAAPAGAASPAAGRYMLTNVASGAAASTAAPGASAAPSTGSAAKPATNADLPDSFVLGTENASVNFGMHVNHKVEVTGTPQASRPGDRPVGTTGSTSPGAPGSATSAAGSRDAKAQTPTALFNVTALKMVSATCP
jgi:hypothetical protein